MKLYMGIDAGAGKTRLCVVDENNTLLHEEIAGSTNPYTVTHDGAEKLLETMIHKAMAALPQGVALAGVCMGAAGPDKEEDLQFLEHVIRRASGCDNVRVVNDGYAALYAVLKEQAGVVVSAGAGSICWAKNEQDETVRVGGWGYLFSDEGSGYRMVSDALQTVCRTIDHRASRGSLLLEQLMIAFGVKTPLELISEIYLCPDPQAIAAYFPLVSKAANEGDPLAREVIEKGMDDLVELVASAARQAGTYPVFTVGMTGAILTKVSITRELFMQKLVERFPRCTILEDIVDVMDGVLYVAKK